MEKTWTYREMELRESIALEIEAIELDNLNALGMKMKAIEIARRVSE
jgi:hypothetical protein